jgi:hypothetical protein
VRQKPNLLPSRCRPRLFLYPASINCGYSLAAMPGETSDGFHGSISGTFAIEGANWANRGLAFTARWGSALKFPFERFSNAVAILKYESAPISSGSNR